ncbi:MAG TPA: sulfatase, partial [Thermoanaerobaculia bacterium]|nr:sulfatase [Thermoanaerobaculia bacterium]
MRRLAAVAALSILACGRGVPAPSNKIPVILISIDTLRSDHLPAYGYTKIATPHLDGFRADAILFEHAYSHVPLTLPSHTTMFTGALPADNGVRDNIGFRLGTTIPTLPELLKRNGYATGAAVSAFVLRKDAGLARGFDFYDDRIDPANSGVNVGRVQRKGSETAAIARTWIAGHERAPFFFFLHLYEPHTPYDPPEPYRSRYASHYDGEIAHADEIVGTFLDALRKDGVYDDALIIILSDHGEGLGEHREQEHGVFLYREALQVPLLLKLPKSAMHGKSIATPVQLSDVFATITSITNTKKGLSLVDIAAGAKPDRRIYAETLFPRFHY